MLALEHNPSGWRLRLWRQRVHHGAVGLALLCWKRTRLIGLALCLHDRHDARMWLRGGWQG